MSPTLEKIAAAPQDYPFDVDTLDECRIASPVRKHEFVPDGARVLMSADVPLLGWLREKLGREPSSTTTTCGKSVRNASTSSTSFASGW